MEKTFSPEFRNRLDSVIPFANLPTEVVAQVVDKFVMQLESQLGDRDVHIELTDSARQWLVKKGYDRAFGARPLGRLIENEIGNVLADEILFGRLANGGRVRLGLKDGRLTFSYS